MDKIISLCKRRGFIYPGSEIYGGLANTWDYGPLGAQLKKNIKDLWWKTFVEHRLDMVGIDAAILMNPTTWEASGHVASFSDPLMDCKSCKSRERADKLVEKWAHENNSADRPRHWAGEKTPARDLLDFITEKNIKCPLCGKCNWTEPKSFNLMFKTKQGVIEEEGKDIYLRPETAQGIFVNFKNVLETTRKKLPFGIAQIGKAFRNEITPGNFTFRTREFEQMEIEYFFDPDQSPWQEVFEQWKKDSMGFIADVLGINKQALRFRDHEKDELSHYSKGTTDIEYKFPFGWGELCAAGAYRTDYDLKQHEKYSGQKLTYLDPFTNKIFTPHVMEPSFGADRVALAVLLDAYHEEQLEKDETRIVMKFKPQLAPNTIAVLPLVNKLNEQAEKLSLDLIKNYRLEYDTSGSIGKRYRRQDEIGTPFCLTFDYDSLDDNAVTVRQRDSMAQERINISALTTYIDSKLYN